jgi:hypothetical protein
MSCFTGMSARPHDEKTLGSSIIMIMHVDGSPHCLIATSVERELDHAGSGLQPVGIDRETCPRRRRESRRRGSACASGPHR